MRDFVMLFLKSVLNFQAVATGEQVVVWSHLLVELNSDTL